MNMFLSGIKERGHSKMHTEAKTVSNEKTYLMNWTSFFKIIKACSFIRDSFAFSGYYSLPWFFYSRQEHVHLHRLALLQELCQSGNLIPLLCFSERSAKITSLQVSFALPWYMISIHAIQFLIEIINWTSPLLAGNFCSGI